MLTTLTDLPAWVMGFEAVCQIEFTDCRGVLGPAVKMLIDAGNVTDLDWMIAGTSLFGWMTPGQLKRFPLAERDQAVAWAAGGAD